jgi:hypothetical protein
MEWDGVLYRCIELPPGVRPFNQGVPGSSPGRLTYFSMIWPVGSHKAISLVPLLVPLERVETRLKAIEYEAQVLHEKPE